MDDSRISITVCGDGGCGMNVTEFLDELLVANHSFDIQESPRSHYDLYEVNGRMSTFHFSRFVTLIATESTDMRMQIRSHNRYSHPSIPSTYLPHSIPSNHPNPPEDSYSVTRTVDGQTYHLALTDTAGQEEYRGLWATSNLKSDAFLLVYDITNAASLDALDYFMQMIDMETEQRLDSDGVPPVKIVAGNKCDLQGARQIRSQTGLEWARARKCGFMETSAREMVNIEETFARESYCYYCDSSCFGGLARLCLIKCVVR